MNERFQDIQALAIQSADGDTSLVPTLIKEIVHYDLLAAVTRTPDLARNLVFHGGTALRLCHQSTRFSEDLDFCCGDEATFDMLDELVGERFTQLMEERYGLETRWEQKKPLQFPGGSLGEVRRWQARVYVPVPGSRTGQANAHRINLEVSRLPSHENLPKRVNIHYPHLAAGYQELLVRTASTREILVDKVLAISNRVELKSRDLWDVDMLIAAETELVPELFAKRFSEPGSDGWQDRLATRIEEMRNPERHEAIATELGRFVKRHERELLSDPRSGHLKSMLDRVSTWLERVHRDRGLVPMRGVRSLADTPKSHWPTLER